MVETKEYENIQLKKEEFAYGFLIEVLTGGLYPDKFHVIREYIQNSFDAISKWRSDANFDAEGSVKVKIDGNSILIFDTGIGMDEKKVNQYRYVGYSEKRFGEATGFRGIGKLSGISVAEKLIITSSEYGSDYKCRLIFNTEEMLLEVINLKMRGENITLNELIEKHTSIYKESEKKNSHYTLVELYNIRGDSKILLNEDNLINFIGMNCPVAFDPDFEFGEEIDEKIRDMVDDYETISIKVQDREVYKPYIAPCKKPEYDIILKQNSENDEQEVLYFSWFCKNNEKGQFEDIEKSGLLFKHRNFTIGNRHLTREKLWAATPERAFYFFGEVYVNDKEIFPTSQRDNFVQNDAREKLFIEGKKIGGRLSKIAGKESEERKAVEKLTEFKDVVKKIGEEYEAGKISKELEIPKLVSIFNQIDDAKKRLNKLPTESEKQESREIMKIATDLMTKIKTYPGEIKKGTKLYDITKDLDFDENCARLYEIIIETIQNILDKDDNLCEEIINKVHASLKEKWNLKE